MLVAAGVGVSVVPASMAQSHARQVAYIPIRGASKLEAPLTLLSREDEANPAALHFLSLAREVARAAQRRRG